VAVLRDDASPPAELRLAWNCERWKTLPEAGGWLDQDYRTVTRMTVLSNVYDACSQWRNLTGERIHLMSEQTRRILRALLDQGINFNG